MKNRDERLSFKVYTTWQLVDRANLQNFGQQKHEQLTIGFELRENVFQFPVRHSGKQSGISLAFI